MPRFRQCLAAAIFALALAPAALAADIDDLPNPLATVRVGQWLEYRHNTAFGSAEQRQKITAVVGEGDDKVITTESVMTMDGEVVDEREESITYGAAMEQQRESLKGVEGLAISPTSIEVKDKTVNGVRVDFTQDEMRFSLYLSDTVPITGVVRMEVEGAEEPVLELIDFGE